MKFRDANYVAGGYVVKGNRVLLLWHPDLDRWVPAGGRVEVADGEYPHEAVVREVDEETSLAVEIVNPTAGVEDNAVAPMPIPASVQEISLADGKRYLDFIYYCKYVGGSLALDYLEARAYKWFTIDELDSYPLYPHVREYAKSALSVCQ